MEQASQSKLDPAGPSPEGVIGQNAPPIEDDSVVEAALANFEGRLAALRALVAESATAAESSAGSPTAVSASNGSLFLGGSSPKPPGDGPDAAKSALPQDADDETLLATLDVEQANAIRVRRRLTMRSIRELFQEHVAAGAPVAPAAPQRKRPWWRWGR